MTSEQQQTATFVIACATFAIWLGVVAWSVSRDIQARREARASVARLERLAAEQQKHAVENLDRAEKIIRRPRGGDGATISTPAPSEN